MIVYYCCFFNPISVISYFLFCYNALAIYRINFCHDNKNIRIELTERHEPINHSAVHQSYLHRGSFMEISYSLHIKVQIPAFEKEVHCYQCSVNKKLAFNLLFLKGFVSAEEEL